MKGPAFLLLAISSVSLGESWDVSADYSSAVNPNGCWSYGRKWAATGTSFDLMTVKWGDSGWYLGNVGHGGPSIQADPSLWAKNNSNGLPAVRWTCPESGFYDVVGQFVAADSRGVDNLVYLVVNGSVEFSGTVKTNQSTPFSFPRMYLRKNDCVDFVVKWNGGVNSEYGWTRVSCRIKQVEQALLTLLTPNGGETLASSTIQKIAWTTTGNVNNVRIYYSTDNGASWNPVTDSDIENQNVFYWRVPNVTSNACLMRIIDAQNARMTDDSDHTFSIVSQVRTLVEDFEDPATLFTYQRSSSSIFYNVQSSDAALTGNYAFRTGPSNCGASCYSYYITLVHQFDSPTYVTGVRLHAREGATSGSAWGGKIRVGHDSTWDYDWWGVIGNGGRITGEWMSLDVPVNSTANTIIIQVFDITSVSLMWLDDIEITCRDSGLDVEITNPASDAHFDEGTTVAFAARCDNGISPVDFVWLSDVDGELGTGETVNFSNLSVGRHVIVVEATDATGLVGSDYVVVHIDALPPAAPVIASVQDETTREFSPYHVVPVLLQGTGPIQWSLVDSPYSDISIDPETGVVSWQNPTAQSSPYLITIRAANAAGSDDEQWRLTVEPAYAARVLEANPAMAPSATNINISGETAWLDDGEPVPNVPVTIHLQVKGTHRTFSTQTDANGQFTYTWTPLPTEAGAYQVSAGHPMDPPGDPEAEFVLLGMRFDPASAEHTITAGQTGTTHAHTIQNLGDTPIDGIAAQLTAVSANLTVDLIRCPDTLGPMETGQVEYSVQSDDDSLSQGQFTITLTGAAGVTASLPVKLTVRKGVPHIVASPASLNAPMVRGKQTIVEFKITNIGAAPTAPLEVRIPEAEWLSLATAANIPPLGPNESTNVILALKPDMELPLTLFTGDIIIAGQQTTLTLQFDFLCVSESKGDLTIEVVDEFTYYADGNPKVAGASVTLENPFTGDVLYAGQTDADGRFSLTQINEAYYTLAVAAESHGSVKGAIKVDPGISKTIRVFLTRQLITYHWRVIPTTLPDRYTISVTADFETNVPVPVVTFSPILYDLSNLQGEYTQVTYTITNHGLVAAQNVGLYFGDHPRYKITPLTDEIGTLAAKTTVEVPVLIQDTYAAGPIPKAYRSQQSAYTDNCDLSLPAFGFYDIPCDTFFLTEEVPLYFTDSSAVCPGAESHYLPPVAGGRSGVWTPNVNSHPGRHAGSHGQYWGEPTVGGVPDLVSIYSDPCVDELNDGCQRKYEFDVGYGGGFVGALAKIAAEKIVARLPYLDVDDLELAIRASLELQRCCPDGEPANEWSKSIELSGEFSVNVFVGPNSELSFDDVYVKGLGLVDIELEAGIGADVTLSGRIYGSAKKECADGWKFCAGGALSLELMVGVRGEGEVKVGSREVEANVFGGISGGGGIDASYCFGSGWSLSACWDDVDLGVNVLFTYEDAGGTEVDFSAEVSKTIIAATCDEKSKDNSPVKALAYLNDDDSPDPNMFLIEADLLAISLGYSSRDEMQNDLGVALSGDLVSEIELDHVLIAHSSLHSAQGICTETRIRLDHQMVVSRDAFNALLDFTNNDAAIAMEQIAVNLVVTDSLGNDCSDLFGIFPPELTGINDVSGSGILMAGNTAAVKWLMIPSVYAAPSGPTDYFVEGTIDYVYMGTIVSIPLLPAQITVLPAPRLEMKYFLEHRVYSDDPFTEDVVEPAIPFSLGLMITNTGQGAAEDLQITSSQPTIIDNDKGLLIDFTILGTRVGTQQVSPSLKVGFGDIDPDETVVAQWLMVSSLQGKFNNFEATYRHVDGLGDERLSLIDSIETHEVEHVVRADYPQDDDLPDFLANDKPDADGLPDTIHLSDGTVSTVHCILDAEVDWPVTELHPECNLAVNGIPQGWVYIRVPNPAKHTVQLASVTRSDGKVVLTENAWTTHLIIRPAGQPSYTEDFLHIFDYCLDETYTYTIVYEDKALPAIVSVNAPPLTKYDQQYYPFSITLTDDVGVAVGSFDSQDVRVTGPAGFQQHAQFVSADWLGNGTPRTATYRLVHPDGTWTADHNGQYQIWIEPGQLLDTSGKAVPASPPGEPLRTFVVSIGDVNVHSFDLVSTRRVDRTVFEYEFAVALVSGLTENLTNCRFEITFLPDGIKLLNNDVAFKCIPPDVVTSGTGTFTVRMDHSIFKNVSDLKWYVQPYPAGDLDHNNKVDMADLGHLAAAWLGTEPFYDFAPPCYGDGLVDLAEVALIAENWLAVDK